MIRLGGFVLRLDREILQMGRDWRDSAQCGRDGECYGGASSEKPLFTGQMRDGESNAGTDTGQDYFNAPYLWANIARFTSPDAPFADQRPEDGQCWNMYAYVRNNPLAFIDPNGTRLKLLGSSEDDRDEELDAIKSKLGKDAQSRLSINRETKDGTTSYYVSIAGDIGEFMRLGDIEHDLANIVKDDATLEFGLTSQDLSVQGGAATLKPGEMVGALQNPSSNPRVLVNPNQLHIADRNLRRTVLGAMWFEKGAVIQPMTTPIAVWHEFGHGWGMMHGRLETPLNYQEANAWENRMRGRTYGPLGPKNARRIGHN